MSDAPTRRFDGGNGDKLDLIISLVKEVIARVERIEGRQDRLEAEVLELKAGQEELKVGQEELKVGQEELKVGQEELKAGHAQLNDRLTSLEGRVDERLRETRPIWEAVLLRLDKVEAEIANGFRRLERRIGVVADDINQLRADLRYLEDRIEKVEQHS